MMSFPRSSAASCWAIRACARPSCDITPICWRPSGGRPAARAWRKAGLKSFSLTIPTGGCTPGRATSTRGRIAPHPVPISRSKSCPIPLLSFPSPARPWAACWACLSGLAAHELGSAAIKAAIERAGIKPEQVDEVIMGNVLQAGQGQAPARQAALGAGLPLGVGCTTIHKVCGSGLKAAMFGHDLLTADSVDVVVAGGQESMSNAPYLLLKGRQGYRYGHNTVYDHMALDGLEDAYDRGKAMGVFAEDCATKYSFTREQQDAFSLESLRRARRQRRWQLQVGDHAGNRGRPQGRYGDRYRRGAYQGHAREDPDAQAGFQEGWHRHRRQLVVDLRRRRGHGADARLHRRETGRQAAGPHRRPCPACAGAELVHHRPGRRAEEPVQENRLASQRRGSVRDQRSLRRGHHGDHETSTCRTTRSTCMAARPRWATPSALRVRA